MNSFAQMEFTVGRLLSRFNVTAPFEGSVNDVKYKFENRLGAFEKLLDQRSELDDFRARGLKLCERLRATKDLRNFFAHGTVRFDVETQIFTVRRILPSKDNPWREVSVEIHTSDINPETSKMGLLTQEFMHFARGLSDTLGLEF